MARGLLGLKKVIEGDCLPNVLRDYRMGVDGAAWLLAQNAISTGIVNYCADVAISTLIVDVYRLAVLCQRISRDGGELY